MTSHDPFLPSLLKAVETAPFGFCLCNSTFMDVKYTNDAFAPMLGCVAPTEHSDINLADYLGQDTIAFIQGQTKRSFDHDALITIGTDNTKRWIRIHIEQVRHDDTMFYALWLNDITAVKESEDKNIQALKTMEAAAEMKSNLLATMSHEIRTPMQSVFGFLELIAEEKPDKRIADMVGTARASASDLLEILDDVLDLAKLDADKMELDDFEIPLRTLTYGVLEAMEVKKYGASIDLRHNIQSDVPFVVKGDPKRLRQIFVNLIGNALKFTKEGHVSINISTATNHIAAPKGDGGIALRFEIADTGIGMDEQTCAKLFQPFQQADNSTTREFGGTGLGLSICKKLVDLMGGQIGITSKVGAGSTFWFEIPTYSVSTDQNAINLAHLDGFAVLVVEDHPKAIIEISNSLRSMGAEVEACGTYQEAFDLIQRRPFDAAVVDQDLPDGYGLNLIRELNERRPYCGLVMYTVHNDYSLQNALRSIGAVHLLKPASRAGLGEAVKGVVKQTTDHQLTDKHRILIAEDTESVREIMGQQLQKLGVQADFVDNGTKALKALETGEYGLLITDLHMPETDGYAVIKHIREQEKSDDDRFPVIVLTADVQMAQRQTYIDIGFDECLLKPVSLAQIRRLMMRWGLLPEYQAELSKYDDTHPENPDTDSQSIDLSTLEEMLGELDDDAVDMLGMFIEMSEPLVQDLKDAYDSKNWKDLSEIGHSLKGSARSIGALALGDICSDIQDDIETASDEIRAQLITHATQEFNNVKSRILEIQEHGF